MKYKISMPIKLLISFLTQLNISVYLGITFLFVFMACNKFHAFFFKEILTINVIFEKIIHLVFQFNRRRILEICFIFKT